MRMMCGTILAAMAFAASFAESVRKQRSYDDMTWGDPYVENISDREGDAPHGTRILQGFPRFQPSECPWNRVETPRSGCLRRALKQARKIRTTVRWSQVFRRRQQVSRHADVLAREGIDIHFVPISY